MTDGPGRCAATLALLLVGHSQYENQRHRAVEHESSESRPEAEVAELQIARGLLQRASQLTASQSSSNNFWVSPSLLQIAEAQMRAGDLEGAFRSIKASRTKLYQTPPLVELAGRFAAGGDWDEALTILRQVHYSDNQERPRVLDQVRLQWITYLTETEHLSAAESEVRRLRLNGNRSAAAIRLYAAFVGSENREAAAVYKDWAIEAASHLRGRSYPQLLGKLGRAQLELGAIRGARSTISLLTKVATRSQAPTGTAALREAAALCTRLGSHERARGFFRQAIVASQEARTSHSRDRLRTEIAIDQARMGYIEPARETLSMVAANEINNDSKEEALSAVALAQLRAGDARGALITADSIIHGSHYRDAAFHAVVDYRLKLRGFDRALAAAERVHNKARRASAYLKIAIACANAGRQKEAVEIASQIELTGNSVFTSARFDFRDPRTWGVNFDGGDAETMASIAVSIERTKEVAGLAMTLSQSIPLRHETVFSESLSEVVDSGVVFALARAHARTGDPAEAARWSRLIGDTRNTSPWDPVSPVKQRTSAMVGVAVGILDRLQP